MPLDFPVYHFFLFLLTFFVGACLGSFLNVVIIRIPQEKSILFPRSHCPTCKKNIPWYYLIPVLGYFFSRGFCFSCKTKISLEYPLVEFLCGVGTFLLFDHFIPILDFYNNSISIFNWIFFSQGLFLFYSGVALSLIDFRHRILPDKIVFTGIFFGLFVSIWNPHLNFLQSFLGGLVPFLGLFIFCKIYEYLRHQQGMGLGDLKYLAMIGTFLGMKGAFYTLFIASVLGSIAGILASFLQKKKKDVKETTSVLQTSLPFGPFLFLAGFILFLLSHSLHFSITL